MLHRFPDQMQQLIRIDRFDDVVVCAALEPLNRGFHRCVAGHDDDLQLGVGRVQPLLQFHAVHPRHANVDQRDVVRAGDESGERLAAIRKRLRFESLIGEHAVQRLANHILVVDDQNPALHTRAPVSLSGNAAVTGCGNGSCIVNSAPAPGADCAAMVPPCCSTILRATASPRPVRCSSSLVVKNGSKICGSTSEGMPGPLSRRRISACAPAPSSAALTVTRPPPGMASASLTSSPRTTCWIWFASLGTGGRSGAYCCSSVMPVNS